MTEIEKKEIEEMAMFMCGHNRTCQDCLREGIRFGFAFNCECLLFAEKAYKKGYRKQSDTVKEFAEKLQECLSVYRELSIKQIKDIIACLVAEYGKREDTI